MKVINADIQNNTFKQIYLLCGNEDYLKKQYRDKLKNSLVEADDNMNFSYYEGDKINTLELLDTIETLPFFADRRVIVIENSGFFKSVPENVVTSIDRIPDTTYIIFVEKDIDKRSKLYKKIKEAGYISEMETPDGKMLVTWINGLCKQENKKMTVESIGYLIEAVGMDMNMLKMELEKLFSYTYGEDEIKVDHINEVCVSQATSKIFDMLDAIGNCNQKKALLLYRDLLELREPAMRILFLIVRQYNILLQVRLLLEQHKDNGSIAKICGVPPFAAKKYIGQAKQYSSTKLLNMLRKCQDTDYKVKTGGVTDTIGVELLIVEFSDPNFDM